MVEFSGFLCDLLSSELYGMVPELPEAVSGMREGVVGVGVSCDSWVVCGMLLHDLKVGFFRCLNEAHGSRDLLRNSGSCVRLVQLPLVTLLLYVV